MTRCQASSVIDCVTSQCVWTPWPDISSIIRASPFCVSAARLSPGPNATPALLTRTSRRPCSRSSLANIARTASLSATSAAMAPAPAPSALAVVSAASCRMSLTTTRAPAWAKRSQMARPIPEPPPVTSAILLSSVMPVLDSSVVGCVVRLRDGAGRSLKAELAARHRHRAAADLHTLDALTCAASAREQCARPPELHALRDLDLLAGLEQAMAHEVTGERSRRRARGRVLGDAVAGR